MPKKVELAARLWAKVDRRGPNECWPWLASKTVDGYGRIGVGGRRGNMLAHRAVWIVTRGPIPQSKDSKHGTVVMHRCDNPGCCNPRHLKIGTQRQNIADRFRKGRDGNHKGTAHGKARFTDAQIIAIRKSKRPGVEWARKFGVTNVCISMIRLRKNWRHI